MLPPDASPFRVRRLLVPLVLSLALMLLAPVPAGAVIRFHEILAGRSTAAMYPSGGEFDPSRDRIVVADTGLDRILFYALDGSKLGGFGAHGDSRYRFDTPRDVAVDGQGRIYVADAANNLVKAYTAGGAFRWSYGGVGKINTPIGVTWDQANALLLVASTGNDRIVKLTGNGALVESHEIFDAPRDVARGPDGLLWVSDYKNHQIKAFDDGAATWQLEHTLGSNGHGDGQLNFPYNMDWSPDGQTLYVSDTGNSRISVWDVSGPTPTWTAHIGTKCPDECEPTTPPDDKIDDLRRVSVVPSGNILAFDFWGNGIKVFAPNGGVVRHIEGHSPNPKGFAQAFGVDVYAGVVYAMDRLNQTVESYDPGSRSLLAVGGDRGTSTTAFSWPEAVAAGSAGVWTADTRSGRIQLWNDALTSVSTVVTGFAYPEDLDVASNGDVYVADSGGDRIARWNGVGLSTFVGGLTDPQGVAVFEGVAYVADTGADRIVKYDLASGNQLASRGGFSGPQGVAVGADGSVWVADTEANRIVHLTAGFVPIETYRPTGTRAFFLPHTLAVAGRKLYVADTFEHRIQVLRTR